MSKVEGLGMLAANQNMIWPVIMRGSRMPSPEVFTFPRAGLRVGISRSSAVATAGNFGIGPED